MNNFILQGTIKLIKSDIIDLFNYKDFYFK